MDLPESNIKVQMSCSLLQGTTTYICVSICKAKRALIHVWEDKSPCQRCSKVLARYKLYRITRLAAEVSLNCHCLVLKKAFFPPLMQTKLFCSQMKQLYIVSALSGAIRVARIEVCSQLRGSVFADVNWSKSRRSARCVAWPSSPCTTCLSVPCSCRWLPEVRSERQQIHWANV